MEKKRIGIIGGGISGTCLGYHLSLYDNAEVTVFEKNTIGGASTAKSAGTVCLFDDSLKNRYWDVRLYGFESYLKMEAEEKGSAGFDNTGSKQELLLQKLQATQENILQIWTGLKKSFLTFLRRTFLGQVIHRMTDILTEQ